MPSHLYVWKLRAASMDQLSKNLACEWASSGIRCNSVKPWCALMSLDCVAHSLAAADLCAALQVHCESPSAGSFRLSLVFLGPLCRVCMCMPVWRLLPAVCRLRGSIKQSSAESACLLR